MPSSLFFRVERGGAFLCDLTYSRIHRATATRNAPRSAEVLLISLAGSIVANLFHSFDRRGGILNSALLSRVWSSMLMRRRIINPWGAQWCLAKLWISARAYPQGRWGFRLLCCVRTRTRARVPIDCWYTRIIVDVYGDRTDWNSPGNTCR